MRDAGVNVYNIFEIVLNNNTQQHQSRHETLYKNNNMQWLIRNDCFLAGLDYRNAVVTLYS